MPRQQLQNALKALHDELETAERLGPDDRDALMQAMREIHETLNRGDSGSDADRDETTLSSRVSKLIEDLEESHPRFAEILSNVSESLANLGI